jgi:hypothetical protein
MEKPYWSFIRAEAKARFLFGAEVIAALESLRSDLADVMSFTGVERGPEWNKMNDRKYQALQNVAGFIQVKSAPLFAPYIRLDQKMPGLWWQRLCGWVCAKSPKQRQSPLFRARHPPLACRFGVYNFAQTRLQPMGKT